MSSDVRSIDYVNDCIQIPMNFLFFKYCHRPLPLAFTYSLYTHVADMLMELSLRPPHLTQRHLNITLAIMRHSKDFDDLLKLDPDGRYTNHSHIFQVKISQAFETSNISHNPYNKWKK